jgi:poly-gamma-glutamate synthesis protein (capsule biosynthesis protein)
VTGSRKITLLAVGDVALRAEDPESQLDAVRDLLRSGDITFGQLEMALSQRGARQLYTRFRGRATHAVPDPALRARWLADAGFTVMSFAGNHTMDRSEEAMRDTVEAASGAGIALIGAGEDIDGARRPAVVDIDGTRFGFLAYCSVTPPGYEARPGRPGIAPLRARTFYEQVDWQPGTPPRIHTQAYPEDLDAMAADIAALRTRVDVLVVSCHWGIHFEPGTIADYQYAAAHAAVDAGADLVLGHHAHLVKAIEVYRGRPILYSLGNLTLLPRGPHGEPLSASGRMDAQHTMVLRCEVRERRISRLSIVPCWLDTRLRPEPLPPGDPRVAEFLAYLRGACAAPGTPRNAWEALFLRRPPQAAFAARTVLRQEGGEIVVELPAPAPADPHRAPAVPAGDVHPAPAVPGR